MKQLLLKIKLFLLSKIMKSIFDELEPLYINYSPYSEKASILLTDETAKRFKGWERVEYMGEGYASYEKTLAGTELSYINWEE